MNVKTMQHSPELFAAIEALRSAELDARDGLPTNLFLLVSSLVPIPNVDLLISDRHGRILLSKRNDPFYGNCWHIPGGCMRYGETPEHRIQETALREIGTTVTFDPTPAAVRNVLRGPQPHLAHPDERGHNVALLYRCSLPESFVIDNHDLTEQDAGCLKWFISLPDDFLGIQHVFDDILTPWRTEGGAEHGQVEE